MTVPTLALHGDTDARHWAERFAHHFPAILQDGEGVRNDVVDLMLTWFACAIETGRAAGDGAERERIRQLAADRGAQYPHDQPVAFAAGYATHTTVYRPFTELLTEGDPHA